uniref:DNA-directed RNA polymerase subunit n=1 Tax=Rhabditophanes sp. KR3021 TaxID=114890 RepID=A0AC35TTG6_9BILA
MADPTSNLSYVGIKFCQECNNMLYPKEDKNRRCLMFACRSCDYKCEADNTCVYVNKLVRNIDELTQIVPETIHDPTLPSTEDHPCPKCGHKVSIFFQAQTSRAEDEMKLYYVCADPKCCHPWCD